MSDIAVLSITLAATVFALAYCVIQTVRDFRKRRLGSASAGVVSTLVVLFVVVTVAYNLELDLSSPPAVSPQAQAAACSEEARRLAPYRAATDARQAAQRGDYFVYAVGGYAPWVPETPWSLLPKRVLPGSGDGDPCSLPTGQADLYATIFNRTMVGLVPR